MVQITCISEKFVTKVTHARKSKDDTVNQKNNDDKRSRNNCHSVKDDDDYDGEGAAGERGSHERR
jgi:hypothetical protein